YSVEKILSNIAVRGRHWHKKVVEGEDGVFRRDKVGKLDKEYYPRIIEDDLWDRAQAVRENDNKCYDSKKDRYRGKGGRPSKNTANLFSDIAKCGYCQARMYRKNGGKHRGVDLICSNSDCLLRKMDVYPRGWDYSDFETSFCAFIGKGVLKQVANN